MEKGKNNSQAELISQIDELKLRLHEVEESLAQVSAGSYLDSTSGSDKNLVRSQYSIEHATDAVFWVNSEGRLDYVNESACKSLGYSRDELLAMTIFDINLYFNRNT